MILYCLFFVHLSGVGLMRLVYCIVVYLINYHNCLRKKLIKIIFGINQELENSISA